MKDLLLIFFTFSIIWSCSNQTLDSSNSEDTSATKDNLIAQSDTSKIEINADFPFGCADLTKFKYPKHWEGDLENYGQLKKPSGKKFDDIGQCFASINLVKTIKSPKFKSLEILKIGDNCKGASNIDTLLQKSIDSCKYRLPNIGTYECYYSYERFGNLLLLDPKTKNGKLLNIYADDIGGDSHTILRYFFIDKNVINIYEGSCYDDGCTLDEKFKIIINKDAEININQMQK
ncbi:MAG: hypothetical protein ACK5DY_03505 [Bacteroidota bacterium]|jgi:hypothetical protein